MDTYNRRMFLICLNNDIEEYANGVEGYALDNINVLNTNKPFRFFAWQDSIAFECV